MTRVNILSDSKYVLIVIDGCDVSVKYWNTVYGIRPSEYSIPRSEFIGKGLTNTEIDDFLVQCEDFVGAGLFDAVRDAIGMSKAFGDEIYEWEPIN